MDTEALKKTLLKKFQEVTADRLQKIQRAALELEKGPAAASGDEVARELHTMKGEARMLGLSAIGQVAHATEDLLKAAREGKTPAQAATDLMLKACDTVAALLEDSAGAQSGNAASEAICAALAQAAGSEIPPLKPGGSRPAAPFASAARPLAGGGGGVVARPGGLVARPPASGAPAGGVASAPAAPVVRREEAPVGAAARPAAGVGVVGGPKPAPLERAIRVNIEVLDNLGQLAGDLLVESARAKLRNRELGGLLDRFARMTERLVRFSEDRLGELQDSQLERIEGDLHLLRDDAFRFVRHHADGVNALHGNLAQLADHVAEARLVPLATVFDAFPRAVREMARSQGKEVNLTIENANVGVDRSLLADVRDALVHILRNAVDHGLETPEVRTALGKATQGKVAIRVRVDGDMLQMAIEDDGRGIDPARVREVAVKRGLMTAQQAAALSDREAVELIFLSGFSTREEVTDLSGRGVGMDVVKRKVEALGGSVAVSSRIGLGSTFSLRLPQSLALMKVLLVRLGDDVYGLPASDVEAVIRVKPEDRQEILGTLAIQHRGKPIALVAMGPLLGLNGGPRVDRPPAVVVRHVDDRAALVVDGFVGEREVAVKPCGGDFLKGAAYIAGTAALEDGRIAVLLQVPDLMVEVRRSARPVLQAESPKRLKILLVDDSPIARATEAALVRALGHVVEEAQDGEEGLERARSGGYDVILTDVQMPKLDGFGFTRRLKNEPTMAKTPVIILSSLASPEDKRRGSDAGADAYLVKGELGVEILAQTIDRLT
jgi:chemotaxis protein histidine kinase CheA